MEAAKNGAKILILEKKPVIEELTRTSGGRWKIILMYNY
jgi:hypothetical protein